MMGGGDQENTTSLSPATASNISGAADGAGQDGDDYIYVNKDCKIHLPFS